MALCFHGPHIHRFNHRGWKFFWGLSTPCWSQSYKQVCSSWTTALSSADCDAGIDGWPLFIHMMPRSWDINLYFSNLGFPGGSDGKEAACNVGDLDSIPGSGRSSGEGKWTYQASLSVGFSRQEYWSELPFPSPGDLPDPGIESRSPKLQADLSNVPDHQMQMSLPRNLKTNLS